MISTKPLILLILDGWGYSENSDGNAILAAKTPYWDALWQRYPHLLLSASGNDVGLPPGQMGNSEVGHLNMGAGRIIYQDFTRIEQEIENEIFFKNPVFIHAIQETIQTQHALHIVGLLSPGGVHSHEHHIHALTTLAAQQGLKKVYIHAFLDGRDTPPKSALASLQALTAHCAAQDCGQIVSVIGRYYAMDRDNRWDRVQQAYDLLTMGQANFHAPDAMTALQLAYERGETDEFVKATTIHADHAPPVTIQSGDTICFMNFRADRARELTRCFVEPNFAGFPRQIVPQLHAFISLTQYATDLNTTAAYAPQVISNSLGEFLSNHQLKQLRLAETEKYAHVTFFFNGGIEKPFPGEDRLLIPSLKVATYDLQPEMCVEKITDALVKAIASHSHDVIVCNFANADMVGHSGDFAAAVRAIEAIDICLGRIHSALDQYGGELLITADHGNAECMVDAITRQPHTAHTDLPIPFLYRGRSVECTTTMGILSDIAPTILYLLGFTPPSEMTGKILFKLQPSL